MKSVFTIIWNEAGVSRAEIAKRTKLSKTTISSLVEELIQRDFIIDTGKVVTKAVGRRPNTLFVKEKSHFFPIINWSRNKVDFSIIDFFGNVEFSQSVKVQNKDQFIPVTVKFLKSVCSREAFKGKIVGCCLVLPGMIDISHDILYSTTLEIFDTKAERIYAEIHEACMKYPLLVIQDTACYAYAEKIYTQIQSKNYAFINFNIGIGASLFVEGKMLGKANGSFTQFGHYSIDSKGAHCACGNRGCLENEIGEYNLATRYRALSKGASQTLPEYLTYEDLGSAIKQGDKTAEEVVTALAVDFGQALRNLIVIVNPDLIVLGGKCQNLGDLFLSQVKEALRVQGFNQMTKYTDIRYTKLDYNSYLRGAMRYFFDIYYDFLDSSNNEIFIG